MLRRQTPVPVSYELPDLVRSFLQEHDASAVRTKETYAYHLRAFVDWATEQGIATLADIDAQALRDYMSAQFAYTYSRPRSNVVKPLAGDTIMRRQRCVSTFLRWCVRQGYIDASPSDRVKAVRPEQRARTAFTPQEARKLVLEAGKADGWLAQRDRAIVLMLLGTGCRASELLLLTPKHFEWRDPTGTDGRRGDADRVLLNGKGRKDRRVRLGRNTAQAVREYLKASKDRRQGPDGPLWVTYRRESMVYSALNAMLHSLGKYAQVEDVIPHRFRHTFAVEWYKSNRDVMALKNVLGHARVEVTQRYLYSLGVEYGMSDDFVTPDTLLA